MRRFEAGDLGRVLAIERASFGAEAWERRLFEEYARKGPELFLVAKLGGGIAGYSITCAGARDAELASIAVDPRYRRRGVAKALLDVTLAGLRARRVKTWWLMVESANEPAIRFYERNGFTRVKIAKRYYGAGRDAWHMRLVL